MGRGADHELLQPGRERRLSNVRRHHSLRLDLTQVDQPYLRPSNEPSAITFGPPHLVLPTRESGNETVAGS
jgi:hypothetical protein